MKIGKVLCVFLPPANEVCEGYVFTGVSLSRGRAWQGRHAWQGGMHVEGGRGHALQGACMAGGCAWQILRDTVNERAVRTLLECILVLVILVLFR